jgi:uncharacterized protein
MGDGKTALKFRRLDGRFAICRLSADAAVPHWSEGQEFSSVTRTDEELSIVCAADRVPPEVKAEQSWVCLKLEGPFAFSQVGILQSFIEPLAKGGVPVFAVSTFDTDYVLVKEEFATRAQTLLCEAGHRMIG